MPRCAQGHEIQLLASWRLSWLKKMPCKRWLAPGTIGERENGARGTRTFRHHRSFLTHLLAFNATYAHARERERERETGERERVKRWLWHLLSGNTGYFVKREKTNEPSNVGNAQQAVFQCFDSLNITRTTVIRIYVLNVILFKTNITYPNVAS